MEDMTVAVRSWIFYYDNKLQGLSVKDLHATHAYIEIDPTFKTLETNIP
jgi:hypothetical protein